MVHGVYRYSKYPFRSLFASLTGVRYRERQDQVQDILVSFSAVWLRWMLGSFFSYVKCLMMNNCTPSPTLCLNEVLYGKWVAELSSRGSSGTWIFCAVVQYKGAIAWLGMADSNLIRSSRRQVTSNSQLHGYNTLPPSKPSLFSNGLPSIRKS